MNFKLVVKQELIQDLIINLQKLGYVFDNQENPFNIPIEVPRQDLCFENITNKVFEIDSDAKLVAALNVFNISQKINKLTLKGTKNYNMLNARIIEQAIDTYHFKLIDNDNSTFCYRNITLIKE